MATAEAWDFFNKYAPPGFVNQTCARISIRGDKYRPVKHARNVRCPVLLQICDHDRFTPRSAAEETVKNLGNYAEVKHYSLGHFDIYSGENFAQAVGDQLAFFKKHLLHQTSADQTS